MWSRTLRGFFFFFPLLLLFGLYVWVCIVQLWNEQVKPIQYSVGFKSRADRAKLPGLDPRFST